MSDDPAVQYSSSLWHDAELARPLILFIIAHELSHLGCSFGRRPFFIWRLYIYTKSGNLSNLPWDHSVSSSDASHSNAISGKVVNPAQNISKFVDVSFKFFLLHRFPTLNTLARPEEWAMLYTIGTNVPRSFSFFPQYLPRHFYYTALRLNQLHGSLFFLFLPSSYWYFSMLTAATHCQLWENSIAPIALLEQAFFESLLPLSLPLPLPLLLELGGHHCPLLFRLNGSPTFLRLYNQSSVYRKALCASSPHLWAVYF